MKKLFVKRLTCLLCVLTIILIVFTFSGCNNSNNDAEKSIDMDSSESVTPQVVLNQSNRKIVYTVDIELTTKNYNDTIDTIYDIVFSGNEDNNWISSDSETGIKTNKTRKMVLRIKTEKLNDFLAELPNMGEIAYYNLNSKDITYNHASAQAEKTALESERDYYQNLLVEIDSDALSVRQQYDLLREINVKITELNTQIRLLNDELTKYDDDVNYSTINITINSYSEATQPAKLSFGARIKNAFFDSINFVWFILKGLFIAIIYIFPFALIGGIVAFIVIFTKKKIGTINKGKRVMKKIKKEMTENKDQKTEKTEQQKVDTNIEQDVETTEEHKVNITEEENKD